MMPAFQTPSWIGDTNNFTNTPEWITKWFTAYMTECYYPAFVPGYTLVSVDGIVQRSAPSASQPAPNQYTYQWDIAYTFADPNGKTGNWEEIFSYKTRQPFYSMNGKQVSRYAVSTGRSGTLAGGVSGFIPLEGSETEASGVQVVITKGYFGATTTEGLAYEIVYQDGQYYLLTYLPGDSGNVYEVLGPFPDQESAAAAGQAHVAEYTIDIINEEKEEARDQEGEVGLDPVYTRPEGSLGTVSGAVSDYVPGFAYQFVDAKSWQDAIDMGVFSDYEITGAISERSIELAGEPLFGYTDAGEYGFDKAEFTLAMGYKLKFDLDCKDFEFAGDTIFGGTTDIDFDLAVIMEGGDSFMIEMGDRSNPPTLSIILDGNDMSPYAYNDMATLGTVDRSARLSLTSVEQMVSTRPEGTPTRPIDPSVPEGPTVPDIPGSATGDVLADDPYIKPPFKPGPGGIPIGPDPVLPDPKPDPIDPTPEPPKDDDDDEEESSGMSGLFLAAGAVVLIALLMFARRSE